MKLSIWRERLAIGCSLFVSLIGFSVLAGYVLGIDALIRISAAFEPTAFPSAVLLLALVVATLMLVGIRRNPGLRHWAVAAWVVVFLGALWQGLSSILGGGLGVPYWDTADALAPLPLGVGLVVVSAFFLCALNAPRLMRFAPWVGMGVTVSGVLLLLGYVYGLPFLHETRWRPPGILLGPGLIGIGLSLIASVGLDDPPLRIFTGATATGRLLRAFVPQVMVLMIGYEFVRQTAHHHLQFHPVMIDFGVTIGMVVLIGLVVATSARRLGREIDHAQRKAREAEAHMQELNAELEKERVEVAAREHKRIGEYLHDNIGQLLTGMGYLSQGLELKLTKEGSPSIAVAREIRELAVQVIAETRHISRGFFAVSLESHGLGYALVELTDFVQRTYGVDCTFSEPSSFPSLPATSATNIYRIAQEGINNAVKHGDASRISVDLNTSDGMGTLTVRNNGHPFSPRPDSDDNLGIGLSIMKQRAAAINGTLSIESNDDGVSVVCRFPVENSN